jgi:23S rRNA U2552 (ribose-2'-O)-methylase RlmE/FtsJ
MNELIEIQEQKQKRLKHKSKSLRSAEAYKLMEIIEEERLIQDQLADFWEPRFVENRPLQEATALP